MKRSRRWTSIAASPRRPSITSAARRRACRLSFGRKAVVATVQSLPSEPVVETRTAVICVAVLCVVAAVRVAATHRVFSPTWDEPLHVASGWRFLAQHRYKTGQENPPLARIVEAWPLRHARPVASTGPEQAAQIYEAAGSYMDGVVASRRGNLLWIILAIAATALLASHFIGAAAGVIAAAIFSLLPPVLAHAGVATPDMAGTAAFALALWLFCRWLDAPEWRRTLWLGFGAGLVLLTKFTFAPFFVVCAF